MKRLSVGRIAESDRLHQLSMEVEAGKTIVTLIQGDAGIGKTRLVETALDRLSGWSVIAASCDETESCLPYALLERLTTSLPQPNAPGTVRPSLSDCAGLAPFAVGKWMIQLIGEMPVGAPTALVVDDAGWADQESLQALTFALRRMNAARVFAVFSVRSEEVHRLPEGLHRLARATNSELRLSGLSLDEVIELAVALGYKRPARRVAMRLCAHTGGNPLYTQAVLEDLASVASEHNRGVLSVPRAFAAKVNRTMDGGSPDVTYLIKAAAILGVRSSLDLAARVADLHDPLQLLEDATHLGLVDAIWDSDGWAVAFKHPLIRSAVSSSIGPATLTRLHVRAASMLDESEALDHLVAVSAPPNSALVARLKVQAIKDDLAGRPGKAADRLLEAARLSRHTAEYDGLVIDAAERLLAAGEVWDASQLLDETLATPANVRQLVMQARLAWLQGRHEDSASLAGSVWRDETAVSAARATAALMLAQLNLLSKDGLEAVRWADFAAAFPDLPPTMESWARIYTAIGLSISGKPEEGVSTFTDLPLVITEVPPQRLEEFWARGWLRMWCDDLTGAYEDLREQPTDPEGWALRPYGLIRQGYLAQVEYRLGVWDDALGHAVRAAALIADTDQAWLFAFGQALPVFVLAARGEWDQASSHVSNAWRAANSTGDLASIDFAATASVHVAACRGDMEGVIAGAALMQFPYRDAQVAGILSWPIEYASALVATSRFDEAREVLDEISAQAEQRGLRSVRAAVARVRGELAAALRNAALAREQFQTADTLCDDGREPFDQGRSWLAHGAFLRREGKRTAAAEKLRCARDTFQKLGARPFLERCSDELAACGFGAGRSDTPQSDARLTPQELAVARLVSIGRTNREVAAQLVLSVKTVGYHLGNIYSKFGLRSRTELAAIFNAPPSHLQNQRPD